MRDKRATTEWTVGKLLTVILVVVLLALIIWGVATGGFKPLVEKIGGMYDSVLISIGVRESSGTGDEVKQEITLDWGLEDDEPLKATFVFGQNEDGTWCEVRTEERISGYKAFTVEDGYLHGWDTNGDKWVKINYEKFMEVEFEGETLSTEDFREMLRSNPEADKTAPSTLETKFKQYDIYDYLIGHC